MRILIAVPAYGGSVRVETMQSVIVNLQEINNAYPEAQVVVTSVNMAEIARVRNMFASLTLKEAYDILIMVDADMSFPSGTFLRLIQSEHEVCGVMYAMRSLDLGKYHAAAAAGEDMATATLAGLKFVAANDFVVRNGKIDVAHGFVEMKVIPAGGMLIRATALRRMWDELPEVRQETLLDTVETNAGLDRVIKCFSNLIAEGQHLSEDFSFCHRWRSIGGQVYGLSDVAASHYGTMIYEGRYIDWLNDQSRRHKIKPS